MNGQRRHLAPSLLLLAVGLLFVSSSNAQEPAQLRTDYVFHPVTEQFHPVDISVYNRIPVIYDGIQTLGEKQILPAPSTKQKPKAQLKKQTPRISTSVNSSRYPSTVAEARNYAAQRIGSVQFTCLDKLFTRESHWRTRARNSSSGAYGIPQALPGSKMAWAGADWRTNPVTQVKWGLHYIKARYGTACGAWAHSQRTGWY